MPSLVTNVGLVRIINALNAGSHTAPLHVGWGTGTTAPVGANTGLETPAAEARTAGTKSVVTTTITDDTYQVVAAITATGTKTITEVGLFDALTAGNMYLRSTFTGVPVEADDVLTFTIKMQNVAVTE